MEPIYEQKFTVRSGSVDRFGRLKPSQILNIMQQVAGDHSALLGTDRETLMQRNLFWAVIRHRVQVTRLPRTGEVLTAQTWPMPTTRTAYPRSTVVYDSQGRECFRGISLWVLMDAGTRAMVLPGKSGVTVDGTLTGSELAVPGSMGLKPLENRDSRTVRFTDLDVNGHMNNCRYLDWTMDALPGSFHEKHPIGEFSVSYFSEAREGDGLDLHWSLSQGPWLSVDALGAGEHRVFSVRAQFAEE